MKVKSHGRYDYSAITERKDYGWPGGKRLAVHFCLNVEHFSFGEGLGNDYAATRSSATAAPTRIDSRSRGHDRDLADACFARPAARSGLRYLMDWPLDDQPVWFRTARRPLVMSVVLHSFILGHPHRLRRFRRVIEHIVRQRERVWLTRPGDIFRHVETLPAGTVPGS